MASKSDEANSKSIGRKKKKKKRTTKTGKLVENQFSGKSSASTVFDVNELSRMNKTNLMSTNKFLTSSKSSNIDTSLTEKGLKSKPKLKNQKKHLFPSIFTGLASSISAVELRSRSFNNDSTSEISDHFKGYILNRYLAYCRCRCRQYVGNICRVYQYFEPLNTPNNQTTPHNPHCDTISEDQGEFCLRYAHSALLEVVG